MQKNEQNIRGFQNKISLNSQDTLVGATVTAIVENDGRILSFNITESGTGYTGLSTVAITVSNPDGGISSRASGIGTMTSGGILSSASIINPGSGYTHSNPPICLIKSPTITEEDMAVNSYLGDYGQIVGVGTTSSGSQNQLTFDLFIAVNSDLRNTNLVGTAITISGISTNDYLTISNTNISIGNTFASEDTSGTTIGIGTTTLDMIYQVASSKIRNENVIGVGTTSIRRIVVNIDTAVGFAFTNTSNMGNFSWGKINVSRALVPSEFNFYGNGGLIGISTSALVTRFNPLKFNNYV